MSSYLGSELDTEQNTWCDCFCLQFRTRPSSIKLINAIYEVARDSFNAWLNKKSAGSDQRLNPGSQSSYSERSELAGFHTPIGCVTRQISLRWMFFKQVSLLWVKSRQSQGILTRRIAISERRDSGPPRWTDIDKSFITLCGLRFPLLENPGWEVECLFA